MNVTVTARKKAMLIYPPGKLFQRGEDRCQGNIEDSSATAMRACNDLGYCAAVLEKLDYDIFLKDYQTEKKSIEDVNKDLKIFTPDIVMISVTNATIFSDIEFAKHIKNAANLPVSAVIVLKGSIFYDADDNLLSMLDLSEIDYLIGGEAELSICGIAEYALKGVGDIAKVDNIFYKNSGGVFNKTRFHQWYDNLDTIPFPARKYMNNSLYTRPDTNEAMATIEISRGCAAACIYCLSPIFSGKKIRYRSPENVLLEMEECYNIHGIKNFFFKADTFTMNAEWVDKLCNMIINSPLNGKIQFTANSRVSPLKEETLLIMKKAGCFLVAFGFESGSQETLNRIKKGTTVHQNLQAAKLAKKAKIPVYGFFMCGFPWETKEDLANLKRHIFEINADFIEIHIALPYHGTELYNLCQQSGTLGNNVIGNDYFNPNTQGTQFLTMTEVLDFRKKTISEYYLRLSYIFRGLADCLKKPRIFISYIKYGLRIIKNAF